VAAQALCSYREQCRLGETVSERVTGRGERRQGPAGIQPRAKQTLTTRFDFGPKFSITPVAPLKIHIHFFVHCTILRRCNGITAASSWSVTVTSLQNTGADADQNCVGLHAPAIPFPTYRKNCSVCFLKLCNAQRRYLKMKPCNSSSALQMNHRTPETQIPTSITPHSPFPHLLHPTIHLDPRWL